MQVSQHAWCEEKTLMHIHSALHVYASPTCQSPETKQTCEGKDMCISRIIEKKGILSSRRSLAIYCLLLVLGIKMPGDHSTWITEDFHRDVGTLLDPFFVLVYHHIELPVRSYPHLHDSTGEHRCGRAGQNFSQFGSDTAVCIFSQNVTCTAMQV